MSTKWRERVESESDDAQPVWGDDGVPNCSESCPHHDGKRCRLIGMRPQQICEPAVTVMAAILDGGAA